MSNPHNLDTEVLWNQDAEQSLLGALLLDNAGIDIAAQRLKPEHFSVRGNATIYEVICNLYQEGAVADPPSVIAELRQRKLLDMVGGVEYINSLWMQVVSPGNIDHYIQSIYEGYEKRELLRIADSVKQRIHEGAADVDEIVELVEKEIFDLTQERKTGDFNHLGAVLPEILSEIYTRAREGRGPRGVRTGFPELDRMTGGLQKSDLIILAARPSVGKTALAMNIALNVALGRINGITPHLEEGLPVGIFSLEMSTEQIGQRLLASLARVSMSVLRGGMKIDAGKEESLNKAAELLKKAPVHIDDTPNPTVLELRSKARRLKSREPNLALIVVDYLQLMHLGGRVENRQQEVAEITRSLKALARELDIPILALSQLSRQVEQRKGKNSKPVLSDLRESGAIEQDADIVMFIHREKSPAETDKERREGPSVREPAMTELIIGKHRNGPVGTVPLIFFSDFASFFPAFLDDNAEGEDVGY